MKILLSGFEAFDKHSVNPSQELAEALAKEAFPFEFQSIVLPVSFKKGFDCLKEQIDSFHPDYVICVGLAEKRDKITPERIAINFLDARIPDNDGEQLKDQPIIKNAPDGLFSTLPIKKMAQACHEKNIPAEVSDTAGTYVCNDLMYKVIHYGNQKGFKAGFIHIPPFEKISLDQQVEGFKAFLREEIL